MSLSTDPTVDAEETRLAKHYQLNDRFRQIGDKNVWSFILGLAQKYGKVNLGQVRQGSGGQFGCWSAQILRLDFVEGLSGLSNSAVFR